MVCQRRRAAKVIPSQEILNKKLWLLECFQNIPCDPCAHACPYDAILPFTDIYNLPLVDYDKYRLWTMYFILPRATIFIIDMNYSSEKL